MNLVDFREWLEENTSGYQVFISKANELQEERNKKRTGKTKKWNEAKIARVVNSMWSDVVQNAYNKIKDAKGVPAYNGRQVWMDFIEEVSFVEMFDDSMNELEFE